MKRIAWSLVALVALVAAGSYLLSTRSSAPELPSAARPLAHEGEESTPRKDGANARLFPHGSIDLEAVKQARQEVHFARSQSARSQKSRGFPAPNWHERGPYNIQGRISDIAVDPTNDDVAFAASASGGIFKTTNGGDTWIPVTDDLTTLSMGAVAIDPSNPNTIYAGTGEANSSGNVYGGSGIYRSVDGGGTWTSIGLEDSGAVGRIVVHPGNSDIIHVAVIGHLYSPGTDRGIYRTDDGGDSWTRVHYINDITGCIDIIQRPDDPDVLFAAMWQRLRGHDTRIFSGLGSGVYRSEDGGLNWALVDGGLPPASEDRGRIGLALCQSNPDVMCAIYHTESDGGFDGLYRSTDGGASWAQTNDGSLWNLYSSFGWWFGNVRIDPNDEDIIYALGLKLFRSTNGGGSYSEVGGNMHLDHHAFEFGSGPAPRIYAGNDGGVYVSGDNGATYTKTTGDFPISQAYRIATADWNTDALWLGMQDNGTHQDLNGDGDFSWVYTGDGMQPLPHLTDPNRLWVQYQFLTMFYSDDAGASVTSATNGISGRENWDAPHVQDPNDPETRYCGTHRVFRNNGNTSWNAISGDLTNGPYQHDGLVKGSLTTIAVSPSNSQVIWTGSDDGLVHVTDDGGGNWSDITNGLPVRTITSVRPHPTDEQFALVTLSGFRWGEEIAHIYRTDDFGQSWEPIGDDLPDMPVNDVFIDPQNTKRYFAATDIGVYQTFNSGNTWSLFGNNLPSVVILDFAYLDETRELFAGTHGRSIYSLTIPELLPNSFALPPWAFPGGGAITDLATPDNEDLTIQLGTTLQPVISIDLKSTSHIANPRQLVFMFEGSVFSRREVLQTISLFNYDTDEYEIIDRRPASRFVDQRLELIPTGDVTRFIQPGSNYVEAQIRFDGTAQRQLFSANIDQAIWWVRD
ncbi:MAG: hypothetical protein AAF456_12225 [Planctomycetota bacterium]